MNPKIGVQIFSVRDYYKDPKTLRDVLSDIARMGYDGVELAAVDKMDQEEVAAVLSDCGLEVAGWHLPWELFIEDLDGMIRAMRLFGCTHAVIPGAFARKYRSEEGLRLFLSELEPISKRLTAEGISLSYHNHNHEMCRYSGKTWLESLFSATAASGLQAELDVYWIQAGGGNPIKWIQDMAGRQTLLHLKDYIVTQDRLDDEALSIRLKAGVGAEPRVCVIGDGSMDLKGMLTAAGQAQIPWYLVEQDEAFGMSPLEAIKRSRDNLVKLVEEVRNGYAE